MNNIYHCLDDVYNANILVMVDGDNCPLCVDHGKQYHLFNPCIGNEKASFHKRKFFILFYLDKIISIMQSSRGRRILDDYLSFDWNLKTNDQHKLATKLVSGYLSLLTGDDRRFVDIVLKHTKYVTFNQFRTALYASFNKFKATIQDQPFQLLYHLDSGIGSEHWLTHLLWPELRQLNCTVVDRLEDIKDGHVVIIDDAIYSGCHMAGLLDELATADCTFHLIIPFVTNEGLATVKSACPGELISYHQELMISLWDILATEAPDLFHVYEDVLMHRWGMEAKPVPCYFDHKVAGEFSSFYQIYCQGQVPGGQNFGTLLTAEPDRSLIQLLANLVNKSV